ncbi:DeoR/GlpR family DNA-binding transcription regulator [Klebsiella aerogenes]|uniref:DeoR/GlpR family DNA-binding transcription regulator n=1 Tax=Klebsiella aerogenes TaxID=548 RepID=UPI0014836613|nr:DeoR/GlpR family DNA-binding transcription regulator [Klebsiella aerogenes]EKT8946708.1 DeoR/GlpR transcriptional regulator [Klebsiella aerogenes]EKV8596914.1 DeoR/GlpR transcriptional regulator [Klebsiella aerogenes]ELA0068023.1 DeoR/GlpR transcriptional regulator [Klebsiella aerogenes]MDQ8572012.1 DeoR/GlpR family DNA-binding transcription regulator [Klebsiella aerogenes]HBT4645847.1 DeoR/GlpR transcriptional regulator [Klebsiella aerogenes]
MDIAEIVRKNGEIKVDDLAEMLAVSGVTIRNDLNYLEQQGYLKRSFGGAIYTAQAGTPVATVRDAPQVTDKALETEMARQVAVQIEDSETLFLGQGSILRKVIPFLANSEELCLLLNDLAHVALAQEFLNGETVLLGGVLSGNGRIVEGDLALKALGHYRPSRALIAVDHVAEDGTLSVRNETSARLLGEAVAQSERIIAVVASRPVYGEKRYAIGELQQMSSVVTPQVVAAEYHARFLAAGLTNSYTNNECLTWLNTALQKTNQER